MTSPIFSFLGAACNLCELTAKKEVSDSFDRSSAIPQELDDLPKPSELEVANPEAQTPIVSQFVVDNVSDKDTEKEHLFAGNWAKAAG